MLLFRCGVVGSSLAVGVRFVSGKSVCLGFDNWAENHKHSTKAERRGKKKRQRACRKKNAQPRQTHDRCSTKS
ncbi:hypothetical protein B0T24DRAFT_636531 [Lasiosphaeria ovina]|uniref:Secreted protein n=1 Tax=Lasiosphaeria ovina TaxID=92902 RepID=A0AAE0MZV4_9PEZI|nr:hypothetical protein B0T24DRAFT_636531 [Lasiosphaeria ovina]